LLRLEWIRHDATKGTIDLDGVGAVTIGRSNEAHIQLWQRTVSSPLHARVKLEAGGWVIEDLGSTNGTFVLTGGRERRAPVALRPGDTIQVGEHGIRVTRIEGAAPDCSATYEVQPPVPLTEAKRRVLRALRRRNDGTRPTVAEAARSLHLSKDTVDDHVDELCNIFGVPGGRGRLDRLLAEAERRGAD
jgi:pSer/pThr/pTyr-binding forkhead associated (FHA) protein